MHDWIANKEAIWLFYVLMAELLVSTYSAIILTVEYFWGRSDTDLKREEKRRKRKPTFENLTDGEMK